MRIEIIREFPKELNYKGYAVAATANWGFTPLSGLVRQLYGLQADDIVREALNAMPATGIKALVELSPTLFIVEKTKDLLRMEALAKELVTEASRLGVQNLILDNFREVHSKLKKDILITMMRSFLMTHPNSIKKTYIFVDNKNYLLAIEALKEIYPEIDTHRYCMNRP